MSAVDESLQQVAVSQANGRALPPECSTCFWTDLAGLLSILLPPRLCLPWSAHRRSDDSLIPRIFLQLHPLPRPSLTPIASEEVNDDVQDEHCQIFGLQSNGRIAIVLLAAQ